MNNFFNNQNTATHRYIAKTFHGLENILADELHAIGGKDIQILTRAVSFEGTLQELYKSNLHTRTATRIIMPFYQFQANNEDELYRKVMEFDWSELMHVDQTFAIDHAVFSDLFKHSKFVALKTKDAIADQFRKHTNKRPSVDTVNADIRFNIHVKNNEFTLSLDSSGLSLHKRGYRHKNAKAPLNEGLSAGMILLTGWDGSVPFIDPMCGSGTNTIEAAMIAKNIPPGYYRKEFGFMNWKNYQPSCWESIKKEAKDHIKEKKVTITGGDISSGALKIARESSRFFSLENDIRYIKTAFEDFKPDENKGVVIINPPYGERMKNSDLNGLYQTIGNQLKQNFSGHEAWILSPNKEALKHVGLKPSKKFTLYNGSLECKYQKFELYAGSRKKSKN